MAQPQNSLPRPWIPLLRSVKKLIRKNNGKERIHQEYNVREEELKACQFFL